MNTLLPVIVIGSGGHGRVLIDALLLRGCTIIGIVDKDKDKVGQTILGISIIGNDGTVFEHQPQQVQLVNGIGSTHSTKTREMIWRNFKEKGYQFANVIHPAAIVAPNACLGEGIQIMAGAVVQTGSYIGANSIVNTRASVDHDCQIGTNVHIAPGVTLSGGVRVGDNVHIGTGATVIQGVEIGNDSIIAAGSVIVGDVSSNVTIMGLPGKVVEK